MNRLQLAGHSSYLWALDVFGGRVYCFSPFHLSPGKRSPPPLVGCTSEVAVLTTGHQTVKWPAEGNVWLVSPGDRLEHLNHPAQSRASGRSSRPPDQTKSEVRSLSF